MNSSVLLQTELQCVPTQWMILDCTPKQVVASWLTKQSHSEFVDTMECQLEGAAYDSKEEYIKQRPQLLKQFSNLYEKGYQVVICPDSFTAPREEPGLDW